MQSRIVKIRKKQCKNESCRVSKVQFFSFLSIYFHKIITFQTATGKKLLRTLNIMFPASLMGLLLDLLLIDVAISSSVRMDRTAVGFFCFLFSQIYFRPVARITVLASWKGSSVFSSSLRHSSSVIVLQYDLAHINTDWQASAFLLHWKNRCS